MQATIKSGANAWSPDGVRDWGKVPQSILDVEVTISGDLGDRFVVSDPKWNNGKNWSVLKDWINIITNESPPEPEPEPGESKIIFMPGMLQGESTDGRKWQNTEMVTMPEANG